MNEEPFNFEKHLNEIGTILRKDKVRDRLVIQLIGLYINLWESKMKLSSVQSPQERQQLRKIVMSILDAITEVLGTIGDDMSDFEFKKLISVTSTIHEWGSQ